MYKILFVKPLITKQTPFEPIQILQSDSPVDLEKGDLVEIVDMTINSDYLEDNDFSTSEYEVISVKYIKDKLKEANGFDFVVEVIKV